MGILRLFLAITVVIAHVGQMPYVNALIGGPQAVQVFFMISGFYMALVLNEKYDRAGPFYWARISKLYSFYFVALAVAIFVAGATGTNHFTAILTGDWDLPSKTLAVMSNLFIVGSDWILFAYPSPDGLAFTSSFTTQAPRFDEVVYLIPAWSLPLEMAFYLIAPFVVRRPGALLGLAALSVISRYFTYQFFGAGDPWSYRFFPSELIFFIIGVGGYYTYRQVRCWRLTPALGWAGLIWLIALMVWIGRYAPISQAVPFSKYGLIFYLSAACALPFIFAATKDVKFDRAVGEFSYPIYLVHIVVVLAFLEPGAPQLNGPTIVAISVLAGMAITPIGQALHRTMLKTPAIFVRRRSGIVGAAE
jgi:peptidoglycan/LPS O-acetylase OafA/YrhL